MKAAWIAQKVNEQSSMPMIEGTSFVPMHRFIITAQTINDIILLYCHH
jgi:hypothetical protein